MANDITTAISLNPIKNGTLISGCLLNGFFNTEDSYVLNKPILLDIQDRYDNRFDDPSYYHGGGGGGDVDGGDVGVDVDVLGV